MFEAGYLAILQLGAEADHIFAKFDVFALGFIHEAGHAVQLRLSENQGLRSHIIIGAWLLTRTALVHNSGGLLFLLPHIKVIILNHFPPDAQMIHISITACPY